MAEIKPGKAEDTRIISGTVEAVTEKFGGGINVAGGWINGLDHAKFHKGDEIEAKVRPDANGRLQLVEVIKQVAKPQEDTTDFPTMLNKAHEMRIRSIQTTLLSHDSEKKAAIFKAVVTMKNGVVMEGHGDADQVNCTQEIAKHYIRFAETRAIARALRWVTNEGRAVKEELKEENAEQAEEENAEQAEDDMPVRGDFYEDEDR
jgi:hypothetical protein